MTFCHCISLGSSALGWFLRLSLSLMTLTILKSAGQLWLVQGSSSEVPQTEGLKTTER